MIYKKKVTKAIFPVAGLGTRFLPATKSIPKEIMTLVDRPLIQYAIDEAREAGITEFIFVTSRGKGALEDYFDHAPQLESELRKKGKKELSTRERMSQILERMKTESFIEFTSLFNSNEGRIGVVVTFLAILELLKDSLIEIVQSEEFGPIHIKGIEEVH